MENRPDRSQSRINVLRRLLHGYYEVSQQLPLFPAWYARSYSILLSHVFANDGTIEFRFLRPLCHPNIYSNGKLCISILHPPGEDEMSGELASERWSPAQRVESVLISILSLLDDAEVSSPANVDAGVLLRKEPEKYKAIVRRQVEESKKDIPEGFVMPTHESTMRRNSVDKVDDEDFWADSDADDDVFGGSDSDEDLDLDGQETSDDE